MMSVYLVSTKSRTHAKSYNSVDFDNQVSSWLVGWVNLTGVDKKI